MLKLKLKDFRNAKGLTQYQLADELDITTDHFRRIEGGRSKSISFEMLEKLCKILDCRPGDLIQVED